MQNRESGAGDGSNIYKARVKGRKRPYNKRLLL